MKYVKRFLLPAVLLLLIAAILFYVFYDRDRREILKSLDRLCSVVESSGTEAPAAAALKMAGADELFTDTLKVKSDQPSIDRTYSSLEAVKNIMLMKRYLKKVSLRFSGTVVDIDGESASVYSEAVLDIEKSAGNRREMREVNILYTKTGGKWKIAEIVITTPLEK